MERTGNRARNHRRGLIHRRADPSRVLHAAGLATDAIFSVTSLPLACLALFMAGYGTG